MLSCPILGLQLVTCEIYDEKFLKKKEHFVRFRHGEVPHTSRPERLFETGTETGPDLTKIPVSRIEQEPEFLSSTLLNWSVNLNNNYGFIIMYNG